MTRMSIETPVNELERLSRLQQLAVLDTAAEPIFDALTRIAVLVTGAPIALISLIDENRQWFKSNIGLPDVPETPRDQAFCAHAILGDELLEIVDARADPRFADNPLVTGDPHIRYYAGAPIALSDGLRMGTLCVIDRTARRLTGAQHAILQQLARAAAAALEQRILALERDAAMQSRRDIEQRLRASEAFLDRTGRLASVGGWEVDLDSGEFTFSDQTCRIHEVASGFRPTMQEALAFYPPEARLRVEAGIRKTAVDGDDWDLDLPFVTAKGRSIWVHVMGTIEYLNGKPRWLIGALQETTIRRQAMLALEVSERRFRKLFQHSVGLIFTHDLEGHVLSINPAAARSLGYSVAEVMGRNWTDFIPVSQHDLFALYLRRILAEGTDSGTVQMIARDGSVRTWQYQNILDDEGDEAHVIVHSQDVSERLGHEKQLRELSIRDPLTGCFNRRFLDELEAGMNEHDIWTCIAIDLDRFKQVNDTHGHQRGDEVLVEVGAFLNRHVRECDVVVRSGGDEFLILLKDAHESIARTIIKTIETAREKAPISFTLGYATRQPSMSLDETLAAADKQLYEQRRLARRTD